MNVYLGVDAVIHVFLTSELDGDEWSASGPGHFTPGEKTTGTHWIGGWVSPRTGLDEMEKRQFLILPGLGLKAIKPNHS
jgi:hypothetical protein